MHGMYYAPAFLCQCEWGPLHIWYQLGMKVAAMTCGVAVDCRTIPSVVRTLGGQAAVNSISTALAPLMQQQHCTVSVLLVMYGLPRLLIGSIVAHELMHAYLRMRHVAGLPLQVRGCGVMQRY